MHLNVGKRREIRLGTKNAGFICVALRRIWVSPYRFQYKLTSMTVSQIEPRQILLKENLEAKFNSLDSFCEITVPSYSVCTSRTKMEFRVDSQQGPKG